MNAASRRNASARARFCFPRFVWIKGFAFSFSVERSVSFAPSTPAPGSLVSSSGKTRRQNFSLPPTTRSLVLSFPPLAR